METVIYRDQACGTDKIKNTTAKANPYKSLRTRVGHDQEENWYKQKLVRNRLISSNISNKATLFDDYSTGITNQACPKGE